uniref:Uncharacterized protein n=1 Tax=Anguilla anguilla TaxID=7936 RepID=A0A0E9Q0Q0_ANGAN
MPTFRQINPVILFAVCIYLKFKNKLVLFYTSVQLARS